VPPQVSIIIPTRDRQATLLDAVQAIVRHAPEAELVVCDNSGSDQARDPLAPLIARGAVRYQHSPGRLSVVDNFERALGLATGEYVMFIGDDDCIGPGLMTIAAWAGRHRIDAVVSYTDAFIANYFWPGVRSRFFGGGYAARLFVRDCTGRAEPLDPREAVRQVAARFGGGLGAMPRAYHGLVSMALLRRIRAKYGAVFGGVSPDIYSATLIAAEAERCWRVDYPFVIPGASAASTAGQGAARTDRGALWRTEHIARFGDGLRWDPRIPEFYAPYTVWAYSMLKALERVPQLGAEPSFPRLYASCYLHCAREWRSINRAFRHGAGRPGIRALVALLGGLAQELRDLAWRILAKLRHPRAGGPARALPGLTCISQAYRTLEDHLEAHRVLLRLEDPPSGQTS
jgi:hypothetical protein